MQKEVKDQHILYTHISQTNTDHIPQTHRLSNVDTVVVNGRRNFFKDRVVVMTVVL